MSHLRVVVIIALTLPVGMQAQGAPSASSMIGTWRLDLSRSDAILVDPVAMTFCGPMVLVPRSQVRPEDIASASVGREPTRRSVVDPKIRAMMDEMRPASLLTITMADSEVTTVSNGRTLVRWQAAAGGTDGGRRSGAPG